jgi:hypothetical protein
MVTSASSAGYQLQQRLNRAAKLTNVQSMNQSITSVSKQQLMPTK